MSIRIDHYHHFEAGPGLTEALNILRGIEGKINKMALDQAKITAAVVHIDSVDDSVLALIQQLADEVRNTPADQAALDKLADDLDAKAQALADAVTANTPAAEPPTPTPTPEPGA